MTREEIESRISQLEERRDALVDQLTDIDAQSATVSSGGGSKSYTNRSVADIKSKIKFCDREIARLNARLGSGRSPSSIQTIRVRFDA